MGRKRFTPIILTNRTITGIAEDSKAVCRSDDGIVCFVEGAVPGDVVDVKVLQKKKGFYLGVLDKIITPSTNRINPVCTHFGVCGGCKWQHMSYEAQLSEKDNKVRQAMQRIGKLEAKEILPIMGCDEPYYYRNKLEFTFSNKKWLTVDEMQDEDIPARQPGLGFHRPGAFDKIVDITHCHLQGGLSNAIRNFVRQYTVENQWPFFNVRSREGLMRNLLIKTTAAGQTMVLVSFHLRDDEKIKQLMQAIMDAFPDITTLLYVVNPKANDTILDLECHVWHGPGYIIEYIDQIQFRIGPKSFFQTNIRQTVNLYHRALSFADLKATDLVFDLYTGIGSIALYAAGQCRQLVGIENVAPAIEDARENAKLNDIENVLFHVGNVEDIFDDNFIASYGKPNVVITDPPRAGMHSSVIDTLIQLRVPKIVYISCNPATQARDIGLLSDTYMLEKFQAVDMFPQTNHVESIALLRLKV